MADKAAEGLFLPSVFSDHMVLQQGETAPVWGKAAPGERVHVWFSTTYISTKAGRDGRWRVNLGPLKPGEPQDLIIQAGDDVRYIRDVLVGEVWVCSGQSNMEWATQNSVNGEEEVRQASYPTIRLFKVARTVSHTPQEDCEGSWSVCSPETVGTFSAVGYFFGRDLNQNLKVPVGLIQSAWGGTPADAWTSRGGLKAAPSLRPILKKWDDLKLNYAKARDEYEKAQAEWQTAANDARTKSLPEPPKPQPPARPDQPHAASCLYNGMLAPIIPYRIKGVIWYQGESNAGRAYQYRALFRAMIRDWRRNWGQGHFPFLFVQLANYMEQKEDANAPSAWAELREAQRMALSLPNTGMAVAIDIGEGSDIHPRNKQDVGKRLALAARHISYGEEIDYSGPDYASMRRVGNTIRLKMKHAASGLVSRADEPLKGFAIAGEDRQFVWAGAEIDGNEVVVWSDDVPRPVAVRYGWGDNPGCNLYNGAGLPATPFRTDSWPGTTAGAQ